MIGNNATVSTKRLRATNGKESYDENILFNVEVYIEPMDRQAAAMWSGENALLMHSMHIDGIQEIKVSDLVIDDEGTEYVVKGVQFFKGGDVPSHTEVFIIKEALKV